MLFIDNKVMNGLQQVAYIFCSYVEETGRVIKIENNAG